MNTSEIQKVVYPLDLLRVEIDKIISEKLFNNELWKEVNKEFEEKGLSFRSLQLLLDSDKKNATDLNEYELIAIAKSGYKVLGWKELNPRRYFSDKAIISYENYINTTKEEKIDVIKFKNFKKINEFDSKGEITYKELYDYLNNVLFIYDHDSQRSPKYREIGSRIGKVHRLRIINLDKKAVESICEAVLDRSFEDTEIILNCEIIKGKTQKYKFIDKYENILGDIIIEPNYDLNASDTTWVSIIDGYHRCMGIVMAMNRYYAKEGVWLDGKISVRLVRATKERAKKIVYQTFQRSQDKIEWVNALDNNDYTKFIDMIVSNSKYLQIENTVDEAIYNEKMTGKSLLVDIFKETPVSVNDLSESVFVSKYIARNFDVIYEIINKENIECNPYSISGYVYVAYLVGDDIDKVFRIMERLKYSEEYRLACRKNLIVESLLKTIDKIWEEEFSNE